MLRTDGSPIDVHWSSTVGSLEHTNRLAIVLMIIDVSDALVAEPGEADEEKLRNSPSQNELRNISQSARQRRTSELVDEQVGSRKWQKARGA